MSGHATEVRDGKRFAFGKNWARFLELLDDDRIARAERSLTDWLGALDGKRFLDVGSGSGLFSLAARRLGATVHSFDYDPDSVACTRELRRRYFPDDERWVVESGSALDEAYLDGLGEWDVVYSWGVLHHTGEMWRALDNAAARVKPNGVLFVAIYNDQGRASRTWLQVKQAYCALPPLLRFLVLVPAALRLRGPAFVRDTLKGRPLATWRGYKTSSRGMSPWRDVVDWVGGLPFEVAKPEAILAFHRARGFELERLSTVGGGLGCNEFVFRRREDPDEPQRQIEPVRATRSAPAAGPVPRVEQR